MEFKTTERGSRKLIKDGFMYVFKKRLTNHYSTRECELHRIGERGAYLKVDAFEVFIEQRNEDFHPPSQIKCTITKAKVNLKRKQVIQWINEIDIVCKIGKCL